MISKSSKIGSIVAMSLVLSHCSTEEQINNTTSSTPSYHYLYSSVFSACRSEFHSPNAINVVDIGIDFSNQRESYDAMFDKTTKKSSVTVQDDCSNIKLIALNNANNSLLAGSIVESIEVSLDPCTPSLSVHTAEQELPSLTNQQLILYWINAGASY